MSVSEKARNGFPSGRATVEQTAAAKVNLFLHVGDKRADGFHPLQSLAVFTEAGDILRADDAQALTLAVEGPFAASLAGEGDNLVLRAARALAARFPVPAGRGAALALVKNLPVASGIGGGSADAAAALRALNALWSAGADDAALMAIAASLGSDIPVCLLSRPAFMEGRGEVLTPVAALPRLPLLLVNPGVGVATKEVFARLTARRGIGMTLPAQGFQDSADLLRFLERTGNDLEAPARALQPRIGEVLSALSALPGTLLARMSGSGATCFALFPDDAACARAAAALRAAAPPGWWIMPTAAPERGLVHEEAGRDFAPSEDGL